MDFIFKKTTDLSDEEKNQLLGLFNKVMNRSRTIQEWENLYLNTPFGYSFHLIMKDGDVYAGQNAGIPIYYLVNGKKMSFICNIDTMTDRKYRGLENIYDIFRMSFDGYRKEGFSLVYGFPNDLAYPVEKGLRVMKDVGALDTYFLPFHIGGVVKRMGILNPLSLFFCWSWAVISSIFASKREHSFFIEKDLSTYNQTRYNWFDGQYEIVSKNGSGFVYKVQVHEGVRTVFLIDVFKKSPKEFCKAIKYIIQKEHKNADIILYVGHLPFRGTGMIKVPNTYEPKHFHFMASILDSDILEKDFIHNIEHWDVNLSNYDLI